MGMPGMAGIGGMVGGTIGGDATGTGGCGARAVEDSVRSISWICSGVNCATSAASAALLLSGGCVGGGAAV